MLSRQIGYEFSAVCSLFSESDGLTFTVQRDVRPAGIKDVEAGMQSVHEQGFYYVDPVSALRNEKWPPCSDLAVA